MYNYQNPGSAGTTEQELIHNLAPAFSSLEGSPPSHTSWAQSVPPAVIPDVVLSPHICDHIQQIVKKEVAPEHAKLSQQAIQQIVENNLSDRFLAGYIKAKEELRKTSHRFFETVFTDIGENGTLHEIFDCSIERWTQTTVFMDAFAALALSSCCITRPEASFVCIHASETADQWSLNPKAKGLKKPNIVHAWPLRSLPFSLNYTTTGLKDCKN